MYVVKTRARGWLQKQQQQQQQLRTMAAIVDDKSQHCLPFILKHFRQHERKHGAAATVPPMFVGLQGVQGAGKTTLVETLHSSLSSPPHNISTIVLSIDDLYLAHCRQQDLARSHADNPLVQHRGVPSTHDIPLGSALFAALSERKHNIKLPSYDKSAFSGAGDRRPEKDWMSINPQGQPTIDLVILEGWCVGFRSLENEQLEIAWREATSKAKSSAYAGQLGKHQLSSLQFINTALSSYDIFTDTFSCFVQIDAEDPMYVYDWRLEQEAALRKKTGSAMTDEQVVEFVNGYYPCYELYTQTLQKGVLNIPGHQLRLVVDKNRRVKDVSEI